MMKIENTVRDLIAYGLGRGLLGADDVYYAANGIFDALQLEPEGDFDPHGGTAERPLEDMLAAQPCRHAGQSPLPVPAVARQRSRWPHSTHHQIGRAHV